jgi:hypothetical protein
MAKIYVKYAFSDPSPYIILVCTEHSAPLAEISRVVLASGAYDGATTFTDLNPVMHRVRAYRSSDGTTLGTVITGASIDATIYNEPGVEIITFEVGAGRGAPHYDPAPGTKIYSNPTMDGNQFSVFQEGYGVLNQDDAVINLKDYEPYTGGGFEFTTDKEFAEGERYTIHNFLVVSVAAAQVIAKPFQDFTLINADFTFGVADYNQFFLCDFAGSVGTVTFPAHASVANFTRAKFSTHGGSQNYLVLQFNGSETVKYFNQNVNVIYLAKGTSIELMWKGGVCYVTDPDLNYLWRGKMISSYDNLPNRPFEYAHFDTGVKDRADYPAIYAYIESLPVGVAVTLSAWNNTASVNGKTKYINRARWGIDTISETFRFPAPQNLAVRYLKGDVSTDTERVNDIPGGYQDDMYLAHDHDYKRPRTDTIGTQYEANRMRSDNSRGLWTGDTVQTEESGGEETRMENFGQIPLIYL